MPSARCPNCNILLSANATGLSSISGQAPEVVASAAYENKMNTLRTWLASGQRNFGVIITSPSAFIVGGREWLTSGTVWLAKEDREIFLSGSPHITIPTSFENISGFTFQLTALP